MTRNQLCRWLEIWKQTRELSTTEAVKILLKEWKRNDSKRNR